MDTRPLTHAQAIALRNQLRKNLSNFKTACRVGAINMSLSEKIAMERNFKAAIDETYARTELEFRSVDDLTAHMVANSGCPIVE